MSTSMQPNLTENHMINIGTLIGFIVTLIVVGLIFWLLHWLIGYCGIPEPFNKIARIVLAIFAVLVVISALLSLIGHPIVRW